MLDAIEQFEANLVRARSIGGLHDAVGLILTRAVDSSDLLRSEFVLAVSALDCFVHKITRMGMLEIFDGGRPAATAYDGFRIPISLIGNGAVERDAFETEVLRQHGYLAFQHPDKIADAIRLFSDVKLWDRLGVRLGAPPSVLKERLKIIVDRRNKIAHEADLDPTYPNTRWPISASDVAEVVDFIDSLAHAIYEEVQ